MLRRLLVLLLLLTPLATVGAPMGFDEARHLLNRTSFAASVEDIESFSKLTRAQAVDQLLAWTGGKVGTPAPAWINEFESPRKLRGLSEEERKAFQRRQFEKGAELRGWWSPTTWWALLLALTGFWTGGLLGISLLRSRAI